MKILFVCLGNICRSPIAEGVMKHLCKKFHLDWEIDSASTNTYHTGAPPHYMSQNICQENGISIKDQRARKITTNDMNYFDLIYVMAKDVRSEVKYLLGSNYDERKIKLFLNELYPNSDKDVPDPWYGGPEDFKIAYDLIAATCEQIIFKYK